MESQLQIVDQDAADKLMAKFQDAKATNEPVLMVNLEEQMSLARGGYPLWLYHATLKPQYVVNKTQATEMKAIGYGVNYIPQEFPKMLFRRNMDPRFDTPAKQTEHAHFFTRGGLGDFIESRTFQTADEFGRAEKERLPKTVIGGWVPKVSDLPPIPADDAMDKEARIQQLEGMIAGLKGEATPAAPKDKKAAK